MRFMPESPQNASQVRTSSCINHMLTTLLTEFWHEFWEGSFEHNGKRRYAEHYELVRSLVPAENLLEYKMGEGWKPLCDFLDEPVPEGRKFPRLNDTEGFVGRCRRRNHMQMLNVLFRASLYGGSMLAIVLSAGMTVRKFLGSHGKAW
ncbi:hypothetical protein MRB53_041282 [Persea americana]|nr:hypothetical protein MRB53_041282 [Persea americana]